MSQNNQIILSGKQTQEATLQECICTHVQIGYWKISDCKTSINWPRSWRGQNCIIEVYMYILYSTKEDRLNDISLGYKDILTCRADAWDIQDGSRHGVLFKAS